MTHSEELSEAAFKGARPLNLRSKREKPLYIVVDSFTMPHAFVIFKTTKLPHLVQVQEGRSVESEDYLSKSLSRARLVVC